MRLAVKLLCFLVALMPALCVPVCGQQLSGVSPAPSSGAAQASPPPAGTPAGALAIKQNFLSMQLAAIQREIRGAQRCIATASDPAVLRDPKGNINAAPQTDILDCQRRLEQLTRQLARLQRKSDAIAQDASGQGALKAGQMQEARRKARLQRLP